MAEDKRGMLAQIFIALMIFSALVGVWTVGFMMSWTWEKNADWKPEFRLVATCANKEACGLAYGDLADAMAKETLASLEMAEPAGEIEEAANWLKWKKENGIYEVKASSWHFQTTVRYRLENAKPVMVEYQDVDVTRAFYYGIAAALFSMIGLYLRRLRN